MFGKTNKQEDDLVVYTIYDSKSKAYHDPSFAPNNDVLIREVLNLFKDPRQARNPYLINAEDYSIFRIGTYSKETGVMTPSKMEHVANMHDLRALLPKVASPAQVPSGPIVLPNDH